MGSATAFWDALDVNTAGEVVAVGNDLSPPALRAAYRAGCFPWPAPGWRRVPWCSPDPRAVLPVDELHVGRSLRARLRTAGWVTTVDTAFVEVVTACAARRDTWITPAMRSAYAALHRAGDAHSVEVWSGGRLVAGMYGVQVGGVFSGESMFHREPDAGNAVVVDLVARLAAAGGLLLDCQQASPHLVRLGAQEVRRRDFLAALRAARDAPVRLDSHPAPAARLAARTENPVRPAATR